MLGNIFISRSFPSSFPDWLISAVLFQEEIVSNIHSTWGQSMTSIVQDSQVFSLPVGQTEKSSIFIQNNGTDQGLMGGMYDKIGTTKNMDGKALRLKSPENPLFVEELVQPNNKESFNAIRLR